MCLYPKFIINRKYLPNKKNKGIPPEIKDQRTKYVPIGCGKCMECKKQRKRQWQVRLQEEIKHDNTGKFITLSLSDKSICDLEKEILKEYKLTGYDLDNEILTLAVRRFLERWRKKTGKSVKHWLVTELGQTNTERIHIHGIIFTNDLNTLEETWQYGNIWCGSYVNERTINYIVKYINKVDQKHPNYNAKILTSAGIGRQYTDNKNNTYYNRYNGKDTKEMYVTRQGIKLPLPIYYRNKIYTDEQRENLWLNLLDKNTRYVNGIKIDVSKDEEDYWKVIKEQRRLNKQLGYGGSQKDKEKLQYEKHLRNLKRLQRIRKQDNPPIKLIYDEETGEILNNNDHIDIHELNTRMQNVRIQFENNYN